MENPGIPSGLWGELNNRLWHATNIACVHSIVSSQEIHASTGANYAVSFSRQLGAISLFDFGASAVKYDHQLSKWYRWFGSEQNSRVSVWLEISRATLRNNLLDASAAHAKWKETRHNQGGTSFPNFIPGVEACHIGPISLDAISRILLIDRHNLEMLRSIGPDWHQRLREIEEFECSLPPAPKGGFAEKLEAAIQARKIRDAEL